MSAILSDALVFFGATGDLAYTPLCEYDPGQWGPPEGQKFAPPGGWHDPVGTA
jgi:hypothetical protein